MQRLCPRCRYAISASEDGTLCFCPHCGAAQVRLSEELLDRMESQRGELADREAAASTPVQGGVPPGDVDWRGALNCAALAGLLAFVLSALGEAVPLLALLGFFWAMSAPVVTLGIYVARFRATRIQPGFAARLGLLSGFAVLLGSTVVNVGAMLVQRLVFHHGADFDAMFNDRVHAVQSTLVQQSGAAAAPVVALLNVPEFRAGMLLSGYAIFSCGYLVFSLAGGAFAGLMRGRRPAGHGASPRM